MIAIGYEYCVFHSVPNHLPIPMLVTTNLAIPIPALYPYLPISLLSTSASAQVTGNISHHLENFMKPSVEQMANIYSAWSRGLPPLQVAHSLRLSPHTVIREYVHLDSISSTLP